ncbi:MAG: hypothetical protein WC607_02330 [Candidatus Micrarchaeia archaeon]
MVDSSAVEYAKKSLGEGFSDDDVKKSLLESGWSEGDSNEAIRQAKGKKKDSGVKSPGLLEKIAAIVKAFTWAGWLGVALLLVGFIVLVWALGTGCEHCIVV